MTGLVPEGVLATRISGDDGRARRRRCYHSGVPGADSVVGRKGAQFTP